MSLEMSLKKKYIKNSFFNVAGWAWLVGLNIATIPYIVHKLGYDAYGVLSLVLLVLGYFAFLDFGLGDAVIKYVSHYYALKDFKKINSIINSILVLYFFIGLIGACLIILFTRYFALKIFKIPIELQPVALFCFYLGAVGFLLNLIFGVISKITEALQRFDLSNRNNILVGTIITISNVLVLFLGYGLREVVIVNLFGSLLSIVIFLITNKKLIPALSYDFHFKFKDLKEVFKFGLYTIFTKFSSIITGSINQVMIGALIGTSGVTIFNVPFKIISRFNAFIYRIAFIIFPLSSELHAQKEKVRIQEIYLKLSKYLFLLSSVFFIPLMAYSKEILFYWMGPQFAADASHVMFLSCLSFYLISWTMVPSLVALGLGKPNYNAAFSFLTAVINLAFVYPLTKAWGVNGAAMALFLSSLQVPIAIFAVNKKIVKIDSKRYFTFVFSRSFLAVILVFLFFRLVLSKLMINGFYFFAIIGGSYFILLWLFYLVGLVKEDRKFFRSNRPEGQSSTGLPVGE